MFASATPSKVSQRQAGAYQQMSAVTGVHGASAHRLIEMLFEGLLGSLAEARGAMRSRNFAVKGSAISRAMRIVDEGLSGALNEADGGPLAARLGALYTYVMLRLAHANLHNDEDTLDECVRLIEPLRSAWAGIADQVGG